MKFFDEAYVGFNRERYSGSDEPRLLGFMVPNGTTAAHKKRIETVESWSQKDIDSRVIKNVPTRGFKIVDVVSRYRSNNKLFRVLDPRGFELEITADNLLDLLGTTTIVNGEIVTDCVWAQHNRSYLVPTTSDEYIFWKKNDKAKPAEMQEGKFYVNTGNLLSVFRFDGVYQHTYLNYEHISDRHEVIADESNSNSYYRSYTARTNLVKEYTTIVHIFMNSGKKPSYLYTEFFLDESGNVIQKAIHIRKGHFKNLVEYDEASQEMKDFTYDPETFAMKSRISSYDSGPGYLCVMNVNAPYSAFFKDKKSAIEFDYSDVIKTIEGGVPGYENSITVNNNSISTSYSYAAHARVVKDNNAKQNFRIHDRRED